MSAQVRRNMQQSGSGVAQRKLWAEILAWLPPAAAPFIARKLLEDDAPRAFDAFTEWQYGAKGHSAFQN